MLFMYMNGMSSWVLSATQLQVLQATYQKIKKLTYVTCVNYKYELIVKSILIVVKRNVLDLYIFYVYHWSSIH